MLGQSLDVRQVFQLEWIVCGKSDVFSFEACSRFLGDPMLGTSEVFVVCSSRKGSENEGLRCGC